VERRKSSIYIIINQLLYALIIMQKKFYQNSGFVLMIFIWVKDLLALALNIHYSNKKSDFSVPLDSIVKKGKQGHLCNLLEKQRDFFFLDISIDQTVCCYIHLYANIAFAFSFCKVKDENKLKNTTTVSE
jgi:hypothetical protein